MDINRFIDSKFSFLIAKKIYCQIFLVIFYLYFEYVIYKDIQYSNLVLIFLNLNLANINDLANMDNLIVDKAKKNFFNLRLDKKN